MSEPDQARLKELDERLQALKAKDDDTPMDEHYSQAQIAWRMVTELVAGLLLGFGIGYGLDSLLETTPLFMVIFLGFGLAAGVKTMMRTASELQTQQAGTPAGDEGDKDG